MSRSGENGSQVRGRCVDATTDAAQGSCRKGCLQSLAATCAELGDDEIRTLAYLANRLLEGQRAYGRIDLETDPRDFVKERGEEIADLLVYTAFDALKRAT